MSLSRVRALGNEEVKKYCSHLRSLLVETVTETGGHLASNLGVVEISVALARQMDLPREKVIYDTGHQCYVHKLLTGRGERFSTLRQKEGLSGFPRREESEFDAFGTGHSGTGISAALGIATAKRLRGEKDYTAVVIGDGSFTGGMVFEALNNITPEDRLIIILNDNGMSIGESVGRLKSSLNRLRTAGYYRFKDEVQDVLAGVPLVGGALAKGARALKNSVKRSTLPMGNLFEQLGLHYFGPADGNQTETVEYLLREAKKRGGPSLIHLCTKKGKGYEPAESNPAAYHGLSPKKGKKEGGESASAAFGEILCRLAREDSRLVAVTAAMADGVGLGEFKKQYPARLFDVGIAEEHALTFAAGLATEGFRPFFAVYSTFYQRAVDQMLHDAALQHLPVCVCLDRAGISGEDGATHHGLFDLPLTLPIPGVRILAPLTRWEMEKALREGLESVDHPTLIRYAKGSISEKSEYFPCESDVESVLFGEGEPRVYVATFGRMTENAVRACQRVASGGIPCRLVRFFALKGFEKEEVRKHFSGCESLLFLEEGILRGGFSQSLADLLLREDLLPAAVRYLGIDDSFPPHGNASELLSDAGLGEENIVKEMMHLAKTGSLSV